MEKKLGKNKSAVKRCKACENRADKEIENMHGSVENNGHAKMKHTMGGGRGGAGPLAAASYDN